MLPCPQRARSRQWIKLRNSSNSRRLPNPAPWIRWAASLKAWRMSLASRSTFFRSSSEALRCACAFRKTGDHFCGTCSERHAGRPRHDSNRLLTELFLVGLGDRRDLVARHVGRNDDAQHPALLAHDDVALRIAPLAIGLV